VQEREEQQRERAAGSEAGRRRRGQVIAGKSSSEAVRAHADDGGDMGCEGVDGKYIDKMQHDRAGPARHDGPVLPFVERELGT
jgi:hypothetical protein